MLKPRLVGQRVKASGTVAIGTAQGDLHDIGKNMVAMMLGGSGYEIVDLGVDVPAEKFIQAIRDGANAEVFVPGSPPMTGSTARPRPGSSLTRS